MPNWVFNNVTIQGPASEVDSIKVKLNEPFVRVHDTYDMETKKTISKDFTYTNPIFALWNICRPDESMMSEYNNQPPLTKASIDDKEAFWKEIQEQHDTSNDWYNWNIRNWGTKWDTAVSDTEQYPDTELNEYQISGDESFVSYRFNTAWAPPIQAIEKLSLLVPNCVISLSYEEESGWGGECDFENGEVTAKQEYESRCRDCDEMDTTEYCDECQIDVCSSCYNFDEADPDDVKQCQTHAVKLESK